MKSKDAMKPDIIELDKSEKYLDKKVLPEDDLCRFLYQLGEHQGDQKWRAADFIWSKNTHSLE